MKRLTTALVGAIAGLGIAAGAAQAETIVVGGKNFTEQLLLSEMTAQLLKAEGFDVEKRDGMGSQVVRDALASAEREGWLDLSCPGFVIGFSAGGSGVMSLANDPVPGLAGAIGYYPLVLGQPEDFEAKVPVLVLQGESDDLTTAEALDSFLASAGPAENFTVHRYRGAEHGFDIPSLTQPVEYNGGVFLYHQEAAAAAGREADAFVARILANRPDAECGGA